MYILILLLSLAGWTSAQEIRLMSVNIRLDVASDGENRWDNRKENLASVLQQSGADLIGAQEVQHHQLGYLLDKLPEYRHIGVGRDDGRNTGEYSPLFYNALKFRVRNQGTFWLSSTPDTVSIGWDAVCNRICTYGEFEEMASGRRIWVFNTHFDHEGKTARLESAHLILRKIRELSPENQPVVLCGDLNSGPEDPALQALTRQLRNARPLSAFSEGPGETFNAFQVDRKPRICIDYILISNGHWVVKRFTTHTDSFENRYPSDHFPISALLILSEP